MVIFMNKAFKYSVLSALCTCILAASGCGMFGQSDNSSEPSDDSSKEERYMSTTKTARRNVEENAEDEDLQGYTTTHEEEPGTLENPLSDAPDHDTFEANSSYDISDYESNDDSNVQSSTSKKEKTVTETSLIKDKLVSPQSSEKFKSKIKYKVTSDTTYLNLRFGPSKDYDIQLRIPDGKTVYGTAHTKDSKGNYWIYTSYKGTNGWVMEELLTKN